MNVNSLDSWILKEFGKKSKNNQVPIGNAYQAKIPVLQIKERAVNAAKEYELKSKNFFFKYVELKSISIYLKKLNGSEIKSIKRNLLNQNFKQFAVKKSGLKNRD